MDYLPFDTVGLDVNGIDLFYNAFAQLKAKFNIQPTGDIDFHLEDMEVFRGYASVYVRGSFVIKDVKNDCYLLFVEAERVTAGRMGEVRFKEEQIWALAYVKDNFGRVLIRRETLSDKIIELVHPVEIDFKEDKAFSDTFYVLANDYAKAVQAITRNFRNAVMDVRHDDFLIEVFDHTLIIGNHNNSSPEKAIHLAEFVARVCSLC